MRYVGLCRHTENDGDALAPDGISAAEAIGRDRMNPPYAAVVSTGAARATQMLTILRRAAGQEDQPIIEASGLRSSVEDRWRDVARSAGKGAALEALRVVDPELVEKESLLAAPCMLVTAFSGWAITSSAPAASFIT